MYKLYSDIETKETILECWGGSTKHPDVVFHFSDFQLSGWVNPEFQTVPWILECASKMNLPYHSYSLAKWSCKLYEQYSGWAE